MPVAWRMVKTKRLATALDGESARRSGGRWNSPGTPMLYASQTIALACLEVLVHLQEEETLPHYVVVPMEFSAEQFIELDLAGLPANWRDPVAPIEIQQMGDAWIKSQDSVVLKVPSVIVPLEHNYLINPRHPEFASVKIGPFEPLELDRRLHR